MELAVNKKAGSGATLSGPIDAKVFCPAISYIWSLVPLPEDILSAWAKAYRSHPDLLWVTCEALRQGGVL